MLQQIKQKKQKAPPSTPHPTSFLTGVNFEEMPFWCNDPKSKNTTCCYNHFIGLPIKWGRECPIFDYQMEIVEKLEKHRYMAILKATGMGITELFLRWTEWMVLRKGHTPEWHNGEVAILVGPSHDKAREMIDRMKRHLRLYDENTTKEDRGTKSGFELNGIRIKCWPSMNESAVRSLPNPKILLVDEACFFQMLNDKVIRDDVERYEAKSSPHVIMWSTPLKPEGFFYDLWHEKNNDYIKIALPYTMGIGKIYTKQEIERQKQKGPSIEQEYNLSWGYGSGDIYDIQAIENSIERYPIKDDLHGTQSVLALDPAYGKASKFGIVGMYKKDGKAYLNYCEECKGLSTSEALAKVNAILDTYHYSHLYIDSAYPDLIAEFRQKIPTTAVNFRENGQKNAHKC